MIQDLEKLAYWIGKKMCAHFYWHQKDDFRQTVLLALHESADIADVKARSLMIRRRFYKTLKEYGYARAADGYSWVMSASQLVNNSDEARLAFDDHSQVKKVACGVPACQRVSANNDERYGRICARCFLWVNKRKRKGFLDVYKGLEDNARSRPL